MRAVCLIAFLGAGAVTFWAPATATAQTVAVDEAPDDVEVRAVAPQVPLEKPGKGAALVFWLFALMTIGGALATITRKQAVTAVMFLVGTFLGIAALYALLYAHFIAVIQVLVYAGAIMVLFVFVVMILNKEEEEPWALRGLFGKGLGVLALFYLVFRLVQVLWQVPQKVVEPATIAADYGTTRSVADTLFGAYLFPFEAVSLVLLIAVVGALVLAHPAHPNVGEEELS